MGNGCRDAASEGVVDGLGESGGAAGLGDSPGKGNCSDGDVVFAAGVDGGQGFAVWSVVQGGGGFWAGGAWAKHAVESRRAAASARVME